MKKISCIIPAYNEAERIDKVLTVVIGHPLISEIIVVDDGSTDNTKDIVLNYKEVNYIRHEKNGGKSKAVYTGILASSGEYILMIDADLIGLNRENITSLINPIIKNEADVTISLRKNAPNFWKKIGIDFISGERLFKKNLILKNLNDLQEIRGFGLEVFLNEIFINNKCSIKIVYWGNVISPIKFRKVWKLIKVHSFLYMGFEILRNISIPKIVYQIISMRKLFISNKSKNKDEK